MTPVEASSIVAILAQGTGTGLNVNRVVPRTPLLDSTLIRSTARVAVMPQWPWQAREPARKRSRTPSESEAGEALHFEDSDFYAHPSAGPDQVQVTDVNDNMGKGGKGDGGQGETSNQFVQKSFQGTWTTEKGEDPNKGRTRDRGETQMGKIPPDTLMKGNLAQRAHPSM